MICSLNMLLSAAGLLLAAHGAGAVVAAAACALPPDAHRWPCARPHGRRHPSLGGRGRRQGRRHGRR